MLTPLDLVSELVSLLGGRLGYFGLGLVTPLTAVCVIPLYPGFVAYLSSQGEGRDGGNGHSIALLGALIALGVLAFMTVLGVVFTTILQESLTSVIGIVSPAAFAALGLLSLVLIADVDVNRYVPSVEPPQTEHPFTTAFGYGFFFGAIIIPCNPGIPALFLSRALLFSDPVSSVLNFVTFGLGIVFPLFALALVSERFSSRVIGVLQAHRSAINRATGLLMLAIAVYYLLAVFTVVRIPGLTA